MSDNTNETTTAVNAAAKNFNEAEKAGKVEHLGNSNATIAEAFKVQIDALRGEATSWRDAAEKSKAELAAAQGRIAELEQVAAGARRSLAETEVKSALSIPGATPLQIRGVLAELGDDIYDDAKRADAIAKAKELLAKEIGATQQPAGLGTRVTVTRNTAGMVRM